MDSTSLMSATRHILVGSNERVRYTRRQGAWGVSGRGERKWNG